MNVNSTTLALETSQMPKYSVALSLAVYLGINCNRTFEESSRLNHPEKGRN